MEPVKAVVSAGGMVLSLYLLYRMVRVYETMNKPQNSELGEQVAKRLKSRGILVEEFDEHELAICADIVFPEDCEASFSSVAGLEEAKNGLRDVISAFKGRARLTGKKLLTSPKGILLYGPPGNGKTLLASAFAKECGASFITLKSGTLFQKYYGESEKFAKSYFSLARKLRPCIIFIDEIDLLLAKDSGFQASHNKVIGTLLSEWDGLQAKGEETDIVIIAASNNPQGLDGALHRRLPRQFFIPPADEEQRRRILELVVLEEEPGTSRALLALVAKYTDRYCGSDLLELCKAAATVKFRSGEEREFQARDFVEAFRIVKFAGATGEESSAARQQVSLGKFMAEAKKLEDF